MRCLALARALQQRGARCLFVCRDLEGHLAPHIEQNGFPVMLLPRPSAERADLDWELDAQQTLAALVGKKPDWLVVDHYGLEARWENRLRPNVSRIMVVDDLADREHACDLLLDQSLVAEGASRYDPLLPANSVRLLGPEYALLHEDYSQEHLRARIRRRPVQNILISFGGSDQHNLTTLSLRAFLELRRPHLRLEVTAHPQSPHFFEIREVAAQSPQIRLHSRPPSLAPLILKAELGLGAAGGTAWERCCLGLPSLLVVTAPNQEATAKELDRRNLAKLVGDRRTATVGRIRDALEEILDSEDLEKMSSACLQAVDGMGSVRVADALTISHLAKIRMRAARREDEAILLRWVNDPVVRNNALRSAPIDPAMHHAWLQRCLENTARCRLFIAETERGLPIGQVRFELRSEGWEIDYSLDGIARGKGLGPRLLQEGLASFEPLVRGQTVFGRVKRRNAASCRVFGALGFAQETEDGGEIFVFRQHFLGGKA